MGRAENKKQGQLLGLKNCPLFQFLYVKYIDIDLNLSLFLASLLLKCLMLGIFTLEGCNKKRGTALLFLVDFLHADSCGVPVAVGFAPIQGYGVGCGISPG
jgi:hypothetical protein